jgi:LysM repeat protein
MQHKKLIILGLIVAIGLALTPFGAVATPVRADGNLLTNPGFEQGFVQVNPSAQAATGWTPWWTPKPSDQPDYLYMQPTYEPSANCSKTCSHRIHSGSNAQRMFQFYGAYEAGLYEQVTVPENADLRFTLWAQGWSSVSDNPENVSVQGTDMRMRIGIDPLGGTNPLDPRVQWSDRVNALDSWYQFTVYAQAQGTRVTVFAYASPFDTRRKNEVYWDDAELVALSGDLQATAQAHYPTATPAPIVINYTPTPVSVALGQNLLVDGGFEGNLYISCSKYDDVPWHQISCDGLDFDLRLKDGTRIYRRWDTVQVPIGWKGWWLTPNNNHGSPTYYQDHPANCYDDAPEGCIAWHNPEYRDTKDIVPGPARIRSGKNAQKYFTFWSTHEAGLLQTVSVPPGSTVRFDVYMHAWSSNRDPIESDPNSYLSSGQTSMHMKVGIDPTGGDNPWAASVIWSPEHDAYDTWSYYEVRAVAQSDHVTVFTHTMPEKGTKHNDVYVDDAELVAVDVPNTSNPPPAEAAPAPRAVIASGPPPTPLPRPDGAIVHIVQPGDTVFGLSLQYAVPMDQIFQLNGLTKDSYLQIGQELILVPPKSSATAEPSPEPTPVTSPMPSPAASATPVAIAAAVTTRTQLCVRAFDDVNGDGVYVPEEKLIEGTLFNVLNNRGEQVASYTSDGKSEPHCFSRLVPGTYTVSIDPASGAVATSDRHWSVTLDQGATTEVNFGSQLNEQARPEASSGDAMLGLALVVIVVIGGWSVYQRRKVSA